MNKMNERSVSSQEQEAKRYEASYESRYKRADALEKKLLKKLLDPFVDAQRLLEVGCGTAHFTRWMESLGFECCGVDISIFMLKEAQGMWIQGCLLQCEASHLPFRTKSMDVVVYVTSLEFMPDLETVLTEAGRVAKKGMVIGLINKWSLHTLRKMLQAKGGSNQFYRNASFYSIRDMKRRLNKVLKGQKIINWRTTVFPRIFGNLESSCFPFGAFLGIAVKLDEKYD
jgi:ubiquinone/menaquinone biosynthesis C-methylase UbiE